MTRVRHTLSLAPATVDRAEEVAREQRAARRGARLSSRPHDQPVTILSIEAEVWNTALGIADGNVARIQRVSPTEVIVHNNPFSH